MSIAVQESNSKVMLSSNLPWDFWCGCKSKGWSGEDKTSYCETVWTWFERTLETTGEMDH